MTAPTVSVSATAERKVAPDSFGVTVTVSSEGADAATAAESLAASYARLEAAVAGLAVDVRHGQVSTSRVWTDKSLRNRAWQANRTMTLAGRDVDAAGDVLAALGGLADVQVDGPYWELDRDNPVHGELQADAVRAARERAERYAVALGGTLGPLVQLSDPGSGDRPTMLQARAMVASAAGGYESMSFEPEQLTVSATVHATWQLVLAD